MLILASTTTRVEIPEFLCTLHSRRDIIRLIARKRRTQQSVERKYS